MHERVTWVNPLVTDFYCFHFLNLTGDMVGRV